MAPEEDCWMGMGARVAHFATWSGEEGLWFAGAGGVTQR